MNLITLWVDIIVFVCEVYYLPRIYGWASGVNRKLNEPVSCGSCLSLTTKLPQCTHRKVVARNVHKFKMFLAHCFVVLCCMLFDMKRIIAFWIYSSIACIYIMAWWSNFGSSSCLSNETLAFCTALGAHTIRIYAICWMSEICSISWIKCIELVEF